MKRHLFILASILGLIIVSPNDAFSESMGTMNHAQHVGHEVHGSPAQHAPSPVAQIAAPMEDCLGAHCPACLGAGSIKDMCSFCFMDQGTDPNKVTPYRLPVSELSLSVKAIFLEPSRVDDLHSETRAAQTPILSFSHCTHLRL